jgi:glycosyltransferase involved in cell wall biosynthesis
MNNSIKISVIIPTFNRSKYLHSTLICLTNQKTEVSYEIIIIDSGNDDTQMVVKYFQKIYSNILYRKIKDCNNVSLLRNTGAENARGDILFFLDNDILTAPDIIQKHFEEHIQKENLVVLGNRNSLFQFDLNIVGESFLKDSFNLLHSLPYIEDHRKDKDFNFHGWRFVYSHSFSLKKYLFIKSGGFDIEFGEIWGYEDMELGYRLYLSGAEFYFLKDSPSFHQPHISNCENTSLRKNINLFIKKHNNFLVELACSYGFEEFEEILSKWENVNISNSKEFQLVFGVINDTKEKNVSEEYRLGIVTPFDSKSLDKVLIKKDILEYPTEMALQILVESERVGKQLFIEKLLETEFQTLQVLYSRIGYHIDEIKHENVDELLLKKIKSTFCNILLPKVFESEKRFVYKWIALALDKKHVVQIFDLLNCDNMSIEDFNLRNEDNVILDKMFIPYFGKNGKITLSASKLNNVTKDSFNNIQTIIDDLDYPSRKTSFNSNNSCNLISKEDFSLLTFAAASTYVEYYIKHIQHREKLSNINFLCFMENGFYEDGINTILESFGQVKNSVDRLVIKMPDYNSLFENSFRLHNEEAIKVKTFNQQQKNIKDEFFLKSKIAELELSDSVLIIKANYDFIEILQLINDSNRIIWNSIGVYVSPEMYVAILLGKTVILSSHHIVPPELNQNTLICKSNEALLSKELDLPNSLDLLNYQAYSIDQISLIENSKKEGKSKINKDVIDNLNKQANKILEKCVAIFSLREES